MFHNYLAACLRNLGHNKLYAAISIFGLAVGLCAAGLALLVIRNEVGYDRFIPGYQNTYLSVSVLIPQGREPDYNVLTNSNVAELLKGKFREVTATTRLAPQEVTLQRGQFEAKETIYWADPNAFALLPLPVVGGDLAGALRRPDGIVLTRAAARKYFGQDLPVGQSLQIDHTHTATVRAVIEDLPLNGTELETGIFASGLAAYSPLTVLDTQSHDARNAPGFQITVRTYSRLESDQSLDTVQHAMPALMDQIWPRRPPGLGATMELVRVDQVHLHSGLNPGAQSRITVTGVVGLLILLVATVNYVNLATARSGRRAIEVGVRKVFGASRNHLTIQFLGESLVYVLIAACLAVVLMEVLLRPVNAFLQSGATLTPWQSPGELLWGVLGVVLLGLLGGIYPALILSSFKPAQVLKGAVTHSRRAHATRQALVVAQFSILVALLICAGVVYEQRTYATHDALRINTDQVLMVATECNPAFRAEVRSLHGVRAAACTGRTLLNSVMFGNVRLPDGGALAVTVAPADAGLLDVFGLKPLAGRFFAATAQVQGASDQSQHQTTQFVINETAVHKLGYPSADAAVGHRLPLPLGAAQDGEIIGVVPDFSTSTVEHEIPPTAYFAGSHYDLVSVKLSGRDIPETLGDIDRLSKATGAQQPVDRFFLDDYIQQLYATVLRQAQVFAVFACIAVLLACLGLFGLAAAATERRVREIGIRKAMGATAGDIVKLLVRQLTAPVLWANLIAWPVAAYLMGRWLHGFAYHIDLDPVLFAGSAALAVIVAIATVTTQCVLVARAQPVHALRYE